VRIVLTPYTNIITVVVIESSTETVSCIDADSNLRLVLLILLVPFHIHWARGEEHEVYQYHTSGNIKHRRATPDAGFLL
jgi:hypothetical protein